jgi:hypothetical protein
MIFFFASFLFAASMLIVVMVMLLRRDLREKYAILWLVIGLGLLIMSSFPVLLTKLTRVLGVQTPANLVFAVSIVLLVGVCLHLSWELSRAEDEIRRVAEETALLRADVDTLQAELATRGVRGGYEDVSGPSGGPEGPAANTQ